MGHFTFDDTGLTFNDSRALLKLLLYLSGKIRMKHISRKKLN